MNGLVDVRSICNNSGHAQYECIECGMDIEDGCDCIWSKDIVYVDLYCHACENIHAEVYVDDLIGHNYNYDDDEDNEYNYESEWGDLTPGNVEYHIRHTCRHYNNRIEFPDGTAVFASSVHGRDKDDPVPDFGLYLDASWQPDCLAFLVDWRDYGLPGRFDIAAHAIIDVFKKARDHNMWVEVGCIGGHGRTGCALACMAVLSGMNPTEAIQHIRTTYCEKAIESEDQEWFVNYFHTFINGGLSDPQQIYVKDVGKVDGPKYSFDIPFDWEEYDITDFPTGGPPLGDIRTDRDTYAYYQTDGPDGKTKTHIIYSDEEEWAEVMEWIEKNPPENVLEFENELATLKSEAVLARLEPTQEIPALEVSTGPKFTVSKEELDEAGKLFAGLSSAETIF